MFDRFLSAPLVFVAAGSTLLVATAPDEINLAVEEGLSVTKTFVTEMNAELDAFSVTVDGEEQDGIPDPEFSLSDTTRVVFVDEYRSVDGDRIQSLVRTFEELNDSTTRSSVDPGGEASDDTSEGESDLEGLEVLFEWDADAEEYEASFVDDDAGDDDLLDGLIAGADFREFLPEDEVEEGDTWEVDPAAFEAIINPSGEVKIVSDEEEDSSELQEQMRDNVSGTIEASFKGIEDGVATIEITVEIDTSAIDDSPAGLPEGAEATQELAITYECEGQLLWDMKRGVAKSLEMGGDIEIQITGNQGGGGGPEVVIEQTLIGDFTVEATFE